MKDRDVGIAQGGGMEELLHERRLADTGLPRDEDQLTSSLGCEPETLVEPDQFRLAADERGSGVAAAGNRWRLRDVGARAGRARDTRETADLGNEPKATPVDG